ncbi:hypothetical protein FNV43_RR26150 [Rhamnella rubrinervis]|uniref:WRKY domain-containing protein n=1 Tax=Rhamnella rubrinervis TaxID=2594499 RepID=A0A8K0DNR8_9ROSA|nr:hypothetical protein FNV43_RR26150 [Rhamnella rubrinervis]
MENSNNSDKSSVGVEVKEEKTTISNGHDHEEGTSAEVNKALNADPSAKETNTDQYSSPNSALKNQEDQLKSAKAEMGEVREENERLKLVLARIMKEYQSLQLHFFDILRQEEAKKPENTTAEHHDNNTNQENEEPELVCLSLGKISTADKSKKDEKKTNNVVVITNGRKDHNEELNGGLELGLGCRTSEILKNNISSSDNSFEEPNKEEEQTDQIWSSPSKIQKTTKSSGDDEVSQQTHMKKARVSVRTRCDAPTMNDGCQWRKYGQKIAKGNPCPRAYYRCTVSPSCPVRKQVQRCAEDMSILITTYEGNHDHPLPISATAMASTTSAAVSMLQSPSSSSQPGSFMNTATAPMSTSTPNNNLHGLNFSSFHNPRLPQNFYFPNTSISTSSSHPTITLDLTSNPSSSSHFGRSYNSSSTCLNFSSSSASSWNNYNGFNSVSYGTTPYQSRNYQASGLLNNNGKRPFQEAYNYMNNNINYQNINASKQQSLTETIAAATKAIASNPKFQTALAAALTSVVGNGGSGARENQSAGGTESLTVKNGIGCGPTSFLNRSSSLNSQQLPQGANLGLLPQTLLSLSASKSATLSPAENMDH